MKRLVLPADYVGGNVEKNSPKEYIICNMIERRKDALGNVKHHTHSDLGVYPIPIPNWVYKLGGEDEGYEKMRVVEGIERYDIGYSMPYTPENVDELAKLCRWNTSYSIERLNGGNRMKVDSLKDFREGVAEELLVLNHIANSQERQYLADMKAGKLQAQPKVYL
jgi:hypothetical protein